MIKKSNDILYYDELDEKKLKAFKLRYLIYGIIILVVSIITFILECIKTFGMSSMLDKILSLTLFIDMIFGALLVTKSFMIKDRIKADSIFNMKNYTYKKDMNGNLYIKRSFSIFRLIELVSIVMNVSLIPFFIIILDKYNFDAYLFFFFAFSILTIIVPIISLISLDTEDNLYNKLGE